MEMKRSNPEVGLETGPFFLLEPGGLAAGVAWKKNNRLNHDTVMQLKHLG